MESYIDEKRKLYSAILDYLENSDENYEDENDNIYFQGLINIVKSQEIEGDKDEMQQFLQIIKRISDNHHRDQYFNQKINQILKHYKEQIKQTLTNIEIFHIFESNKKIILFLLKSEILTISDHIYSEIKGKIETNGINYWHFFIPEIENFIGEENIKFDKEELLNENQNFFINYEKNRQEGENDSYICSLIRQDLIEEFIPYVNLHNISLSSQIVPSIFETNSFLIDRYNTTLIEYSAFFGSIQIFQYLFTNKVKLTPSLWIYVIHSKNAELINFLETNKVPPPIYHIDDEKEVVINIINVFMNLFRLQNINREEEEKNISNKNYIQCLKESIKCHHNDIADYIENNFLNQEDINENQKDIISNCIEYYNYNYFKTNSISSYGFAYLCIYHYDKLVHLLLKMNEETIKKKIILFFNIFNQEMISNKIY